MGTGVIFMLLAAAVLAVGCREPLAHAAPSAEALGRDVLSALEHGDAARLRELAVAEREFREVIWPELPAARPERNLPAEYVWADLRMKSEAGLRRLLAEHGGKPQRFVRVDFGGETTQHQTYLIRRETIVVVQDAAGRERPLRLFGSTLERDGGFKVFSYVTD